MCNDLQTKEDQISLMGEVLGDNYMIGNPDTHLNRREGKDRDAVGGSQNGYTGGYQG